MSRRAQLVLLCEDLQHEVFLRRFLSRRGWQARGMRIEKAPPGRGAAEQYVRERFPRELREYRRQHVDRALVIMLDGDRDGVSARTAALDKACRDAGVNVRTGDERVAVFVPTWCIETWLAYLDGGTVDEEKDDYPRLHPESECQRHVDELDRMCRGGTLRQPAPKSLDAAWNEFRARLK